MASSPIIAGKVVLQVVSGNSGSLVVAVGRYTGETLWRQELAGVMFATPVQVARPGAPAQVFLLSTGEWIAFDAVLLKSTPQASPEAIVRQPC